MCTHTHTDTQTHTHRVREQEWELVSEWEREKERKKEGFLIEVVSNKIFAMKINKYSQVKVSNTC